MVRRIKREAAMVPRRSGRTAAYAALAADEALLLSDEELEAVQLLVGQSLPHRLEGAVRPAQQRELRTAREVERRMHLLQAVVSAAA
eukprot:1586371-Prymnesium_polylepis.1